MRKKAALIGSIVCILSVQNGFAQDYLIESSRVDPIFQMYYSNVILNQMNLENANREPIVRTREIKKGSLLVRDTVIQKTMKLAKNAFILAFTSKDKIQR